MSVSSHFNGENHNDGPVWRRCILAQGMGVGCPARSVRVREGYIREGYM